MLERSHVELDLIPAGLDGAIRRVSPHGRPRIGHRHAELEFNLVVAGRGAYVLHDRRYELRPGTLVWLFPWQDHVLLRSAGLELWVVVARADLLDTAAAPDPDLACRMLAGADALALERLLAQVAKETDEPAVFNAGLAYATRRAWRMSRAGAALTRYPMHPAVAKALLLLNRDDAPASLAALAEACGLTPSHLSRLLVRHTGTGLVGWRNQLRLERFHAAYGHGGNLLESALSAGFGSYAQFYRVYRAAMKAGPGRLRPAAQPKGRKAVRRRTRTATR